MVNVLTRHNSTNDLSEFHLKHFLSPPYRLKNSFDIINMKMIVSTH